MTISSGARSVCLSNSEFLGFFLLFSSYLAGGSSSIGKHTKSCNQVKQISAAFSLYRKSENHSYPAGADSDLGRCYQTPVSGCIQSAVVKMFYGRSIIPVCRADVSVSLISNIFVLVKSNCLCNFSVIRHGHLEKSRRRQLDVSPFIQEDASFHLNQNSPRL